MISCFTLWIIAVSAILCSSIPSSLGKPPNLKSVQITPQSPVLLQGQDLRLTCTYDLALQDLYMVKWYREGQEFFRYAPRQRPVKKEFEVPGIKVKIRDCDHHNVVLRNASHKISGIYKCTVTAEQTFETVSADAEVNVVWIPLNTAQPNLTASEVEGSGLNYSKKGFVAECVTPPSIPGANITWLLEGQEIHQVKQVRIKNINTTTTIAGEDDLIASHSTAEFSFPPKPSRNPNATFTLTCRASVFEIFDRNTSIQINVTSEFDGFSVFVDDENLRISASCGLRISGSLMNCIILLLILKWFVYM